jgi:GGDEF domain-containing protein
MVPLDPPFATPARATRRVAVLLERWSLRSASRLAPAPAAWRTPAVVAVAEALAGGSDPIPSLRRLGEERAAGGLTLDEALDDLGELVAVVGWRRRRRLPLLDLAAAAATGWAEGMGQMARSAGALDSLTGLPTLGYLDARLAELYRHCAELQVPPEALYRFVVVQLERPPPSLDGLARTIEVAALVQEAFAGGETVVRIGRSAFIVLASTTPALPYRVDALRERLPDALLWLEWLEPDLEDTRVLLHELARLAPL